ncbi:MAG: hypothetical protein ACOYXR_04400 [Nitrospirota bacterium]
MNHRTIFRARGMRLAVITIVLAGGLAATAHAAPLGVPAATTGAGKTALGAEVNVLVDRDLTGGGEAEGSQIFAKGTLGIDERLDLDFRLGFGDFGVDPGSTFDSDIGPSFGVGMRVTWATVPSANLKIGSVFQTTHTRTENDAFGRLGWTEHDAALGVSLDMAGARDPKRRQTEFGLVPYGGFAWSGLDIDGGAAEDNAFGLFAGLNAKAQGNVTFGVELRLVDQTAISVSAGTTF